MRSADVYNVNRRVGQHRFVIVVDFERSPILMLHLFFILLTSRTDGCDLSPRNLVEGRDVRPGDPAQSDYANVDVIHLVYIRPVKIALTFYLLQPVEPTQF